MARTTLTVQTATLTGLGPSFAAGDVANGNQFAWPGTACWVEVKNTGGSPMTVTIQTPLTVGGLAVADVAVSVPATTGDRIIPIKDAALFVQSDGYVYIDLSAACTIGVFTM